MSPPRVSSSVTRQGGHKSESDVAVSGFFQSGDTATTLPIGIDPIETRIRRPRNRKPAGKPKKGSSSATTDGHENEMENQTSRKRSRTDENDDEMEEEAPADATLSVQADETDEIGFYDRRREWQRQCIFHEHNNRIMGISHLGWVLNRSSHASGIVFPENFVFRPGILQQIDSIIEKSTALATANAISKRPRTQHFPDKNGAVSSEASAEILRKEREALEERILNIPRMMERGNNYIEKVKSDELILRKLRSNLEQGNLVRVYSKFYELFRGKIGKFPQAVGTRHTMSYKTGAEETPVFEFGEDNLDDHLHCFREPDLPIQWLMATRLVHLYIRHIHGGKFQMERKKGEKAHRFSMPEEFMCVLAKTNPSIESFVPMKNLTHGQLQKFAIVIGEKGKYKLTDEQWNMIEEDYIVLDSAMNLYRDMQKRKSSVAGSSEPEASPATES